MNILEIESPIKIEARTSKFDKKINITYSIVESYHNLCIDKKEIMKAQIQACENLSKYASNKNEVHVINNEISQLKFILNILN
ncbi:MAG: hypothetical protein ACPKQO_00505 [Nitrososphaeraceae archaeon]